MVNSMKIQDKRTITIMTTQLEEVLTTQTYMIIINKTINLEIKIELSET